jgi:hypothetical protein
MKNCLFLPLLTRDQKSLCDSNVSAIYQSVCQAIMQPIDDYLLTTQEMFVYTKL